MKRGKAHRICPTIRKLVSFFPAFSSGSGGVPTSFRFIEAADIADKILVTNNTGITQKNLRNRRHKEIERDRASYSTRQSGSNQNENSFVDFPVNQPPWTPNDEPVGGMRIDHIFLSTPNSTATRWKADMYIVDDSMFPEDLPKYGYPSGSVGSENLNHSSFPSWNGQILIILQYFRYWQIIAQLLSPAYRLLRIKNKLWQ